MISDTNFQEIIRHYAVLLDLGPPLLQDSIHLFSPIQKEKGQAIFQPGDPCQFFLMVTSGKVRVIYPGIGHELLLYSVAPGDVCILTVSCLLGNTRYPAQGIVEENLNGVLIPKGLFLNWVEKSEVFRTFTFHFFGERLIQLMALLDQLAFGRLNQRLASLLLANGEVVHWTHQKIAEDLGSAREVVSRTLKELESQGMVKLGRGKIHILDRSGLSNLAAGVSKIV